MKKNIFPTLSRFQICFTNYIPPFFIFTTQFLLLYASLSFVSSSFFFFSYIFTWFYIFYSSNLREIEINTFFPSLSCSRVLVFLPSLLLVSAFLNKGGEITIFFIIFYFPLLFSLLPSAIFFFLSSYVYQRFFLEIK